MTSHPPYHGDYQADHVIRRSRHAHTIATRLHTRHTAAELTGLIHRALRHPRPATRSTLSAATMAAKAWHMSGHTPTGSMPARHVTTGHTITLHGPVGPLTGRVIGARPATDQRYPGWLRITVCVDGCHIGEHLRPADTVTLHDTVIGPLHIACAGTHRDA